VGLVGVIQGLQPASHKPDWLGKGHQRVPPLICIVIFPLDDLCDLKTESSPTMDNEITAKERGFLEENNEKEEMDQERAQEGEQEWEEKKLKEEADEEEEKRSKEEEHEPLTEEQELEELRAQMLQLLLELEDARETSSKHQESFHELQGETSDTSFIFHFFSITIFNPLIVNSYLTITQDLVITHSMHLHAPHHIL
ncbi:hypothetical protein INR49_017543, partial [Caranx melampygus]